MSMFKQIEAWFETQFSSLKKDVTPGFNIVLKGIPTIAIDVAKALLAGVEASTPWATLGATLISILKSQGIALAEEGALAALNTAQTQNVAAGTPSAITQQTITAITSATPLPIASPAVAAATVVAEQGVSATVAPANGATTAS